MEKMDLQKFRKLKEELLTMIHDIEAMTENGDEPAQDFLDEYKARFIEIYKELFDYDLSDIDYEEWRDMPLYNSDEQIIDLSDTNANIDFSLIEFIRDSGSDVPNFKGCNIRNFDFENIKYIPEMFDEKFIADNQENFLSDDAPEELKQAYYNNNLTIQLISDNLEFFKGKKVLKHINRSLIEDGNLLALIDFYGEELVDLFEKYKPVLDILINHNALRMIDNIWETGEQLEPKTREEFLSESVMTYFLNDNYPVIDRVWNVETLKIISEFIPLGNLPWRKQRYRDIFSEYTPDELLKYGITDIRELLYRKPDLYTIKELLDNIPDDLIFDGGPRNAKIRFIRKYGIDNIIKLDEETNGIFSHELWKHDIYLELFARIDLESSNEGKHKELSYEDLKNRVYDLIVQSRREDGLLRQGIYPAYDFIQGEFREQHNDIFLDGDLENELKRKFYVCELTAKDIHDNPEIITALKNKDLASAFLAKRLYIEYDENGIAKKSMVNMVDYFTEKFGNEEFLKLCKDYGMCLDSINPNVDINDSIEDVRDKIEDKIYNEIINQYSSIEYFEDLPESFRNKHPELFLPGNVPEDIRTKFYTGKLSFGDLKQHPELKDLLLSKNTRIGFRKSSYKKGEFGSITPAMSKLWNVFTDAELMDLAENYGSYLDCADTRKLFKSQTLEEKISNIESSIEDSILSRETPFGFSIPEFFRKKHPELFLSDNAPDDLKAYFDEELFLKHKLKQENSNNIDNNLESIIENDSIISRKLNFQLIKEHPEWKPYLIGKNYRLAFPNKYDKLFEHFDCDTLLRIGVRNPETIQKMVELNKVGLLETWFKAMGGKFIPHHIVMNYFPEDEIESYKKNARRWSKLIQSNSLSINDDGKAAILKMAYSFGVFKGNNDGFQLAMDLIYGLPERITDDDFKNVMNLLENNPENIAIFESVYKQVEDGNYILSYNQQNNKRKTKLIREFLEKANVSTVLTLEKAHQIFGGFEMKYDPNFVVFFKQNTQRILSDYDHLSDISQIQRRFNEILIHNSSVKGGITLDIAYNYIRSTPYDGVEVGNERLANMVSQRGYSQKDFERLQELYNEAETRNFSSIPRVTGEKNGYTYEMLRLDDPLGLIIGKITDCCQEINEAASTSMEHSMISQDGRVFVVRDKSGRVVAQSWVWRNQNVLCFDNIEIPRAIMEGYAKIHPDEGKKGIAKKILDAYKQASRDIMIEDEKLYKELLENGTITREEYESLILGKITVGIGWNDTAEAIKEDRDLVKDDIHHLKLPVTSDRFPYLYTDAKYDPIDPKNYEGQWIIKRRKEVPNSNYTQARAFEDNLQVFDDSNIDSGTLFMIQKMSQEEIDSNIRYLNVMNDGENKDSSDIMRKIAYAYGFNIKDVRVLATPRIALIYAISGGQIEIGDIFTSPLKNGLTQEQQLLAQKHIRDQIAKALKQLKDSAESFDLSDLNEKKSQLINSILKEIEDENKGKEDDDSDERGE